MSSIERYVQKARDEFKARPILPLGAPVRLGAVGVLEKDQFSPRGNVRSVLGGRVGEVSRGRRANWQVTSGRDVRMDFVASGEASTVFPNAPTADARVEVAFSSSDSLLVSVGNLTVSTMTNPADLLQRMLVAAETGLWQEEYVLVYEIIVPADVLVLLSREADSKFLLGAKAKIEAPQGTADLAGKFKLRMQSKDAVKLDSGHQPLFFNAFRVKRDVWSGKLGVQTLGVDDLTAGVFDLA